MVLSVSSVNNSRIAPYAFTSRNEDDKKRVTTSDVATATGATGAVTAAGTKSRAFSMFNSSSKIGQLSSETTQTLKMVRKPISQVKGLLPKFMQAFRNTKCDILKWADGVKNTSFIKPLVKSKFFGGVAGVLGAITGIFVTITGIGDIANTIVDTVSK